MIGGGGHALSLLSMMAPDERPEAYVALNPSLPGLEWLGNDDSFLSDPANNGRPVIIGFVAPASCSLSTRRHIIERCATHPAVTVVAPSAEIAPDVVIGAGSEIFRGVIINSDVFLGDFAIVNTGAIIEHGVTCGSNVFIGPGAIIAGGVTIGRDIYIGAGAILRNNVHIADNVIIGCGAVVTSDITEAGVYVGVPARPIHRTHDD